MLPKLALLLFLELRGLRVLLPKLLLAWDAALVKKTPRK